MERDGNCLFRAVADQVYCNNNLYASVRTLCANHMQEEEKYFSEFVWETMDWTNHITVLRNDGAWAGNFEIIAMSQIFKRSIEVYEHSEEPKIFDYTNNQGYNGPPIRLFFRNRHYASVRSDRAGDLFNFEGLELEEIDQQYPSTSEVMQSKEYKKRIQSVKDFESLNPKIRQAIEQSIAIEEANNAYLRFYASRVMKQKTNEQN